MTAATATAPSTTEIAQQAVAAPQPTSPPSASADCFTPSLNSILTAFQKDGNNDAELLKIILRAKEKEDEVSRERFDCRAAIAEG